MRGAGQVVEWAGLPPWRAGPVDERTVWGKKGPVADDRSSTDPLPPLPATLAGCGMQVCAREHNMVAVSCAHTPTSTVGACVMYEPLHVLRLRLCSNQHTA